MNPIVGIGELLWDVYPDGRRVAGGAPFNFAFHCHQLGHPAVIVSRVGNDELGRDLRAEVRRLGLSDEYIQTDPDHPTGTVQVTLDAAGVPSYVITENVAWDYIERQPQLSVLSQFAQAVSFGSLAQRSERSAETIDEFLTWMAGKLRVYDMNLRPLPGRAPGSITLKVGVNRAEWLKLNEEELIHGLRAKGRFPSDRKPEPTDLWHGLFLWSGPKIVLLTKGGHGCEVWTREPGEEQLIEPGVPARVVDTVGAGDAFTAAMVCLSLEGRPLHDCARFANHYAARVCEHHGATPRIDRREVELAAFGN
jgi:fructokinase